MIKIDLGKEDLNREGTSTGEKKLPFGIKIPEKYKEQLKKLPPIKVDLVGGITVGVALAFSCLPYLFVAQYKAFYIKHQKEAMRYLGEQEQGLRDELAKYSAIKTELDNYEQQKRMIQQRITVVRDLLASRGTPVNILDAIGQSLPPRTWLTNVDLVGGASPTLNLQGQAYSNDDITDFSERLMESIYLTDISLEEVSTSKRGDIDVRAFNIKALPKGMGLPDKPAEKDPKNADGSARAVASQPPAAK